MPLKITCQRDGFWRAGKQHFREAKVWADDAFTPEQVKMLKEEPMLMVVEVKAAPSRPSKPTKEELMGKTVEELQAAYPGVEKGDLNKEPFVDTILKSLE